MIGLGKKSVIWKWIFSYICIVLVSAISTLATFYRSQSIIEDRQSDINKVVLEQAAEQIHDCVMMMEKLREEILTNPSYTSLNKSGSSTYSSTTYKQYLLYEDLNTYLKLNNRYSQILLYFERDNKVIANNSVNTLETYWKVYRNETFDLDFEKWSDMLKGNYTNFSAINLNLGNEAGTAYARTIQGDERSNEKINLFIFFTKSDWNSLLKEYQFQNSSLYMVFSSTAVKFDPSGLIAGEADEQHILNAIEKGKKKFTLEDGKAVHMEYLEGAALCNLYIITPESVYLENIQSFQILFNFIFFITILFCLVLIIMFVQNNYKPIKDLLKTIAPGDTPLDSKNENEIALVKKGVAQVKNQYAIAHNTLERQNKILHNLYLSRFLSGGTRSLSKDDLEEVYGIRFLNSHFLVILLYVDDIEEEEAWYAFPNETETAGLNHAQLVLYQVYSEVLKSRGWNLNQTKVDETLVLLVDFPAAENDELLVDSVIQRGRDLIEKNNQIEFSVAVSNCHDDLGKLPAAYQEALQALEAKRLYGLDNTVYFSKISEFSGSSYQYSYEVEQDFMRSIQLNNYSAAKAIFDKVIENNINREKFVSHDIMRCLMFDLLGTVMKTFSGEEGSQDFIKQNKPAKRLSECRDLQSMIRVFEDILYKSCECFQTLRNGSDQEELCFRIRLYIEEHYRDHNLSVMSIAGHFGMPPVAMSRMFRDITGIKIASLLSEIRVREAKRLLLTTSDSLNEIAEQVGFGSTKTFTRFFKQTEDSTPGQWREIHFRCADIPL